MLHDVLSEGRIEFSQRNLHGHGARISNLAILAESAAKDSYSTIRLIAKEERGRA